MTPAYPPGDWEEVTDPEYVIQDTDFVQRRKDPWEGAVGLIGRTVDWARCCPSSWRVIRPRRAAQETSTVNLKEPAMKLFIVAVIYTPKDTELPASLHISPAPVLAKDEMIARMKAAKMIDSSLPLDQCEVLVRPF